MIHVTEKAAKKIRELLAKEGVPAGGLRLGVRWGGREIFPARVAFHCEAVWHLKRVALKKTKIKEKSQVRAFTSFLKLLVPIIYAVRSGVP